MIGDRRERSEEPDPRDRGHGALEPADAGSFVAELARRLQGHGLALALPLTWIEQRLAESSLTIEQMVQSETQQQAADQVSISNSDRQPALSRRDGLARVRRVDERRRAGAARRPRRCLPAMDFATRDRYRHVVARLASAARCRKRGGAGRDRRSPRPARDRDGRRHRHGARRAITWSTRACRSWSAPCTIVAPLTLARAPMRSAAFPLFLISAPSW